MQFRRGASVFTSDGQHVGEIDRVVIDPKTDEITHVVVEKGFLLTVDKVVPISLIGPATENRVTLRENAGDLEALPDFEEKHYVLLDEKRLKEASSQGYPRPLHWYPPVRTMWWHNGGYLGYPGFFGYTMPPYVLETERNIPEGTIALREGAKVLSSDGKHVGDVEAVLTDPEEDRATHLVISQGLLLKERKLVPTSWISMVMSDEIHLAVGSHLIEGLQEYEPQD
jgi:sporulation protein YlmC with PRC-barrel domain